MNPSQEPVRPTHQIDEAARALGLERKVAYVPTQKTRSKNAERVARSKAEAEKRGQKSVSLSIPTKHHEALKALASDLREGVPLEQAIIKLTNTASSPATSPKVRGVRSAARYVRAAVRHAVTALVALLHQIARRLRLA